MTPLEYLVHLYLPFSLPLSFFGAFCLYRCIRLFFENRYYSAAFELSLFIGISAFLMSLTAVVDLLRLASFVWALVAFIGINAVVVFTLTFLYRRSRRENASA